MPHQQEPFPSSTPAATWQDTALNTFLRFQRFLSDAVGLFLLAFALIMLLALVGWTEGALISPLANLFRKVLGYGSVFIALIILWVGWQLVRRRTSCHPTHRMINAINTLPYPSTLRNKFASGLINAPSVQPTRARSMIKANASKNRPTASLKKRWNRRNVFRAVSCQVAAGVEEGKGSCW